MHNAIKEALLRVTEIVNHTETERSQEVHGHDKACEKFHFGALPSAAQSYHAFETGGGKTNKSAAATGSEVVRCDL